MYFLLISVPVVVGLFSAYFIGKTARNYLRKQHKSRYEPRGVPFPR
jgi:hypothetical protein